jgi:hypothetical protein
MKNTGTCRFDHRLVDKATFDAKKPPERSRSGSPVGGAKGPTKGAKKGSTKGSPGSSPRGGKGKGGGKSRGKKKGGGYAAAANSSGSDQEKEKNYKDFNTFRTGKDGKRLPFYCHQWLKEKKCENTEKFNYCKYHHWDQNQIDKRSSQLNDPSFKPKS